jgi:hypothetical protein
MRIRQRRTSHTSGTFRTLRPWCAMSVQRRKADIRRRAPKSENDPTRTSVSVIKVHALVYHARACLAANLISIHAAANGVELRNRTLATLKTRYESQARRNRVQSPTIAAIKLRPNAE